MSFVSEALLVLALMLLKALQPSNEVPVLTTVRNNHKAPSSTKTVSSLFLCAVGSDSWLQQAKPYNKWMKRRPLSVGVF